MDTSAWAMGAAVAAAAGGLWVCTSGAAPTGDCTVEYAHRSRCALGEGACWDPHNQRLLWIDIVRGKLFSYDPKTGENRDLHMKQLLGTVVPVDEQRLESLAKFTSCICYQSFAGRTCPT